MYKYINDDCVFYFLSLKTLKNDHSYEWSF